jgi:hypothetical protein
MNKIPKNVEASLRNLKNNIAKKANKYNSISGNELNTIKIDEKDKDNNKEKNEDKNNMRKLQYGNINNDINNNNNKNNTLTSNKIPYYKYIYIFLNI